MDMQDAGCPSLLGQGLPGTLSRAAAGESMAAPTALTWQWSRGRGGASPTQRPSTTQPPKRCRRWSPGAGPCPACPSCLRGKGRVIPRELLRAPARGAGAAGAGSALSGLGGLSSSPHPSPPEGSRQEPALEMPGQSCQGGSS